MMAKELTTEQEALDELRKSVNAALGKRWMIALWVVEDKKGIPKTIDLAGRITWKFPAGDFDKALQQLAENFEEEKKSNVPPVPPLLKMADFGVFDGEEEPTSEDAAEVRRGVEEKGKVVLPTMDGKPPRIGKLLKARENVEGVQ